MDNIINTGNNLNRLRGGAASIYDGLVKSGWMNSLNLAQRAKDALHLGSLAEDVSSVSWMGKIAGYASKAGNVLGKVAPYISFATGGWQVGEGIGEILKGRDTGKGITKIASGGVDIATGALIMAAPATGGLSLIPAGILQIGKLVAENWGPISEGIKNFASAAGKAIGDFAREAGNFLHGVGNGLANVGKSVVDGISGVAKGVGDAISGAAKTIGDAVSGAAKGIGDFFSGIKKAISG